MSRASTLARIQDGLRAMQAPAGLSTVPSSRRRLARPFTDEEIAKMRDLWPSDLTKHELAAIFDRSWGCLQRKARKDLGWLPRKWAREVGRAV